MDKNPKIRNPLASERTGSLSGSGSKRKAKELHEKSSGQSDSPTQYGTEKIESVQYRAAECGGKKHRKNHISRWKKCTYRKIKERKSRQEEAKAAEEAMEQDVKKINQAETGAGGAFAQGEW